MVIRRRLLSRARWLLAAGLVISPLILDAPPLATFKLPPSTLALLPLAWLFRPLVGGKTLAGSPPADADKGPLTVLRLLMLDAELKTVFACPAINPP